MRIKRIVFFVFATALVFGYGFIHASESKKVLKSGKTKKLSYYDRMERARPFARKYGFTLPPDPYHVMASVLEAIRKKCHSGSSVTKEQVDELWQDFNTVYLLYRGGHEDLKIRWETAPEWKKEVDSLVSVFREGNK